MKITKFGHCCLLIEENGVRILTDPGNYSTQQSEVQGIDFVLITHEHADHFHLDSLRALLKNNPEAKVITNQSVGLLLEKENISFTLVKDGQSFQASGVSIEGVGKNHALIYPTLPIVQNTGYFIANKLFYPGDALTQPEKTVELLALPVAGPWIKIQEAIDYALQVHSKVCFPIHDGNL